MIVCPHADLSNRVHAAFSELGVAPVRQVSEYPRMGTIADMAGGGQSNICLLDVATNPEHALLLISEAAAAVPVVALYTRNDADLILRCLRRGASEFLGDPSAEQLRGVLERLQKLHAPQEPPRVARTYCVVPGKPGAGATTLAVHLAVELKYAGAERVLLVDTDVQDAAVGFLFKLKPDFHLGDAIRDRKRMDNDLWGRLAISCHGIDVLLSPENPATPVDVDRQAALELMAFWRTRYDAIVMDTGGSRPSSMEFARLADEILLVSTNELVALHASRRTIEYLELNGVDRKRLRLVMNRYTPATGLKREEVEIAMKLAPFALLANEYDVVQQAVLEGRPLAHTSRFSRSVAALAAKLSGQEAPVRKRASFLGLFSQRT